MICACTKYAQNKEDISAHHKPNRYETQLNGLQRSLQRVYCRGKEIALDLLSAKYNVLTTLKKRCLNISSSEWLFKNNSNFVTFNTSHISYARSLTPICDSHDGHSHESPFQWMPENNQICPPQSKCAPEFLAHEHSQSACDQAIGNLMAHNVHAAPGNSSFCVIQACERRLFVLVQVLHIECFFALPSGTQHNVLIQ